MSQQTVLDEIVSRLDRMDSAQREKLIEEVMTDPHAGREWAPSPGPQFDAYNSKADVLLYGGQAGGGKSGLLVGLSLTRHKRSLLMRRRYTDTSALIEDLLEKYGTRDGYSGAPPARLRAKDGRLIEFGAAKDLGDEESWRGQAHDFLGIDEASQFHESQVRFLMGWVRSVEVGQRCRVILATNPPEKPAEGQWLIKMFSPWLDKTDPRYPQPHGKLLWVVSDEEGKDKWVDGPEEVDVGGRMVKPSSRTFIPAALEDNPFLSGTGYDARLDALPEPLRSAVRDGNWMIAHEDNEWQIIPTNWVLSAQERWTRDPPDAPMCSMGVDVAQGGSAETVLQPRYDMWFAEPISAPGRETPLGSDVAALVIKHRRNNASIIVDMGGGYGGATYECLDKNGIPVTGFKGAEKSSARTKDRQLKFLNKRAESWWRFREALDPEQEGGSPVMLPPDSELAADLVSVCYEVKNGIIRAEDKKEVVKRLGRSPDRGDAAVMALATGKTYLTHGQVWRNITKTFHRPRKIGAYEHRKRRRS